MQVVLVKRNKVIHCGLRIMGTDDKLYDISICNKIWDIKDKSSIGNAKEVTCKRCQKKLAKADENGRVTL